MKKFNAKDILIPTIVLFLIAFVCTALLAVTDSFTAKKIEDSKIQNEIDTRDKVFPNAKRYGKDEKISYENKDYTYCAALDAQGNIIGYVFTTNAKGYGGDVVVMTGIDSKNGKVTGVETLEMTETAGLGMNAQNPSFRNQYVGHTGQFEVVKNNPTGDHEIQALTGATITSKAVTTSVNLAISLFETVTGGGK